MISLWSINNYSISSSCIRGHKQPKSYDSYKSPIIDLHPALKSKEIIVFPAVNLVDSLVHLQAFSFECFISNSDFFVVSGVALPIPPPPRVR